MTYRQVFKQKEEMDQLLASARNIYRFIGSLERYLKDRELDFDVNSVYSSICAGDCARDADIEYRELSSDYFAVLCVLENMTDNMWDEEIPHK